MVAQPSSPAIIAGCAISLAIAAATLVLRLIARVHIVKVFGVEDAFLVAALALSVCHVTGVAFQVRLGLGTNVDTFEQDRLILILKALFWSILCYVTGHTLTKISILCLYTRVFRSTTMQKIYPIMLAVITIHGLFLIFSGIFGCVPVRAFWDVTLPRNCLPRDAMWFSNAGVNIATDFALFITPLAFVKTLKMPKKQKIGLYVVFLLGLFGCIISLVRLYYLYYGAQTNDITRDLAGVSMWSAIELNVAIICASLMVMKPLVARFFPALFAPPAPTDSYPFSYVTPLTVSQRSEPRTRPESVTLAITPPASRGGVSTGLSPSMDEERHPASSTEHVIKA